MKISDFLAQVRGDFRSLDAFFALIEIAANRKEGGMPTALVRSRHLFSRSDALPLFEVAANALLHLDRRARFDQISEAMDSLVDGSAGEFWIRKGAAEQMVSFIGDSRQVRFSFGMSLRVCLIYAMAMSEREEHASAEFCDVNASVVEFVQDLAVVLDLKGVITATAGWPWSLPRTAASDFEVMLPPVGAYLRDDQDVPGRILGSLGLEQGKRMRLSAEGVAITDAIANVNGRAIISVSDGSLFRMVGAEPVVRRNLIESGRLQAVMAVPPGMAFTLTMIRTNLLMLNKSAAATGAVRFVDLGHPTVSQKGRRGRYEVSKGVVWAPLPTEQPDARGFVRAVTEAELRDENFVLIPERYLNTGPRERIDAFLADSHVEALGDLVEMVRPVSLLEDEGGDYLLFEAAPSDIGKRGFVCQPARSITVDRVKFNKAANQILKAGDILIAIKGTVGVVGMVPQNVPDESEREIWTAGQSMMILRPKRRSGLTALALFEYLSNSVVQEFIQSLASGTAIQTISMKDLTALRIPVPDAATTTAIEAGFAERQTVFDQIDAMEERLLAMRANNWPHAELQGDA